MKIEKFTSVKLAIRRISSLRKKKIKSYLRSIIIKEHSSRPWKIEWIVSYKEKHVR